MSKKRSNKQNQPEPAPQTPTPVQPLDTPADQPAADQTAAEPTLEQQLAEAQLKWQRLAADYQNYQKRANRQIEQARQFGQENIAAAILPVLDNFQHTLQQGQDSQDLAAIMQGVQIVHDHLLNVLQQAGMQRIEIKPGDTFDPNHHQAILHVEHDEIKPNAVVQELAAGYTMNDRTLRPAKVSVSKPPTPPQSEEAELPTSDQNQTDDNE